MAEGMNEVRPPKNEPDYVIGFDDFAIAWGYEPCAICGRSAVRTYIDKVEEERGQEHKEPTVCNRRLVDLRGDMATELEREDTVSGFVYCDSPRIKQPVAPDGC